MNVRSTESYDMTSAISLMMALANRCPDRLICPETVAQLIDESKRSRGKEAVEVATVLHGAAWGALDSGHPVWDGEHALSILIWLPHPASGYYLPAVVLQAVSGRPNAPSLDEIVELYMTPPDNAKRDRMISYAARLSWWTQTQRDLLKACFEFVSSDDCTASDSTRERASRSLHAFWEQEVEWICRARNRV